MEINTAKVLRIRELMMYYGLNNNKLAQDIGVSRAAISKILRGGTVGSKVYSGISKAYPEVNMNYLYSGEGELIMSQQEKADIIDWAIEIHTLEERVKKFEDRLAVVEKMLLK